VFQRCAAIARAVEMVQDAGLSPGIYTGSWWWPSGTGNTTQFCHLPLWNSYYDQDPDVDGLPYGGWTAADVAIEQYSSTTVIAGRGRDLDHIYEQEEEDMTADQVKAIAEEVIADKLRNSELIDAGQLPELIAMIVGAEPSSFTDPADIALIDQIQARLGDRGNAAALLRALADKLEAAA
jgi:hypothetical protein